MNKTTAEQYADKLYYNWMTGTRAALANIGPQQECEVRGNLLISDAELPPFNFLMLRDVEAAILVKLDKVWCNTHNVSVHPMVGYVYDTGGRPQLMMWVKLTPRKSVLREQRG